MQELGNNSKRPALNLLNRIRGIHRTCRSTTIKYTYIIVKLGSRTVIRDNYRKGLANALGFDVVHSVKYLKILSNNPWKIVRAVFKQISCDILKRERAEKPFCV